MEVAPLFTLWSLLSVDTVYTVYTFQTIYTAKTVTCMPTYIVIRLECCWIKAQCASEQRVEWI